VFVLAAVLVVVVGAAAVVYEVTRPEPTKAARQTTSKGVVAIHKAAATTTTTGYSSVTISAVGDTDLGNTPALPPDPSTYLQPVEAALHAPIVFGNFEGTLTNATTSKCGSGSTDCYAFQNPPAYAQILKAAGFTVINSATGGG
jgi:hypothetical protein